MVALAPSDSLDQNIWIFDTSGRRVNGGRPPRALRTDVAELGASTGEAEENCAVMVAEEARERVEIDGWGFEVLAVPGHTVSHIAFSGHGVLFCGDTLFSLGCGRMFEGTEREVVVQQSAFSRVGTDRILKYAFELAQSRPRKHLTLIHKTNVLVHSGQLWSRVVEEVSMEYPDVSVAYSHIDAAMIHLVTDPGRFADLAATNMNFKIADKDDPQAWLTTFTIITTLPLYVSSLTWSPSMFFIVNSYIDFSFGGSVGEGFMMNPYL